LRSLADHGVDSRVGLDGSGGEDSGSLDGRRRGGSLARELDDLLDDLDLGLLLFGDDGDELDFLVLLEEQSMY
jgi:hypothetical protein